MSGVSVKTMPYHRIWFLLIFLTCAQFADALRPDAAITQYPHDEWASGHGLFSDSIYSVVQTSDGYIWFATSEGLARFNGYSFKILNTKNTQALRVNRITALLRDRDESLWIGTDGGGLLNYSQGKFKTFTVDDGLSDNSISALARDGQGNVWVLTSIELNKFSNGKFSSVSIDHVRSIFADQQGALIGTADGLSVYQDEKITHFPGKTVTAVYRNRKGEIWLGVKDQGLSRLVNGTITPVLQTEEILSILEDRDQTLWLGTRKGLRHISGVSQTHPDIHLAVTSLMEDHEGSIWITTAGSGIHRLRPSAFITYGFKEGLEDPHACCILQDREGVFWIGTDQGLTRWKDGVFTNHDTPSPVRSIALDSHQNIWIGTSSGVFRWNGSEITLVLPDISVKSLVAGPDDNLWIGSYDGLKQFSNGKLTQLSEEEITSLFLDHKGDLWVGTSNGLKQWKNDSLQQPQTSASVRTMQEDSSGNLWIGSSEGLQSIRNGKITKFGGGEGMSDLVPYSILPDDEGNMWMSTRIGIIRVKIVKGKLDWSHFTQSNGLRTNECSDGNPSGWKDSKGNLWFATVNGISTINANHFFTNQTLPPVLIEQVEVDRVPLSDMSAKDHTLPSGTARIEFQYAGLSYLPPVRFRYVLKGFDHFWTNAAGQTRTIYTNLPPGKYTFKVLACNNNELWNIRGASFDFEIESAGFSPNRISKWFSVFIAAFLGLIAGWFLKKYL
jgi:ligand-binding sensor domain-containing protein